ncbi:MAG: hypothetical protein NVV74_24050 [Magnetospirillum sp.]|nr:hypothetical protein [Magnetospirillum sp.]
MSFSTAATLTRLGAVVLELLDALVEVGLVGPRFGLGLAVGLAEVGAFGEDLVQDVGQHRDAGGPLLHILGVERLVALHHIGQRAAIGPDQGEGGLAGLDGLTGRRSRLGIGRDGGRSAQGQDDARKAEPAAGGSRKRLHEQCSPEVWCAEG